MKRSKIEYVILILFTIVAISFPPLTAVCNEEASTDIVLHGVGTLYSIILEKNYIAIDDFQFSLAPNPMFSTIQGTPLSPNDFHKGDQVAYTLDDNRRIIKLYKNDK